MSTELLDLMESLEAAATPAPWAPQCGAVGVDDADWRHDEPFIGWEINPDVSADRRAFARGADCHLVCLLRTHAKELIAAARLKVPSV